MSSDNSAPVLGIRKHEGESEHATPRKKARFAEPEAQPSQELKWSYHVNKQMNLKIGIYEHICYTFDINLFHCVTK